MTTNQIDKFFEEYPNLTLIAGQNDCFLAHDTKKRMHYIYEVSEGYMDFDLLSHVASNRTEIFQKLIEDSNSKIYLVDNDTDYFEAISIDDDEDLFENYKSLPTEVQTILAKYSNDDETYNNCQALVDELETIGWTCDYDLGASPFGLRKL